MNHILLKKTFDDFSFLEGEIITFNRFTIEGKLHKGYFDEAPSRTFSYWRELRDYCLFLIKGQHTPLSFRLVFALSPQMTEDFLSTYAPSFSQESISGLYLNFRFDGTTLCCVTGTTLSTFSMDKSIEQGFDVYATSFFRQNQIASEEL